jgi:hypothetical protein
MLLAAALRWPAVTDGARPMEVRPGIWCWYVRHPEWHPRGFDVVTSYALRDDAGTLLVDPLVTDATLPELDQICTGDVRIAVTVPFHVRSAEQLAERYDARIYGHKGCRLRLQRQNRFTAVEPGFSEPGGARFHGVGRPRRQEQPVEVPTHAALVTGDVVALPDGELRVWETPPGDERRQKWYDERFLPSLVELADATRPRHLLVTHGVPLLDDGEAQLRAAFARPPWWRHGG